MSHRLCFAEMDNVKFGICAVENMLLAIVCSDESDDGLGVSAAVSRTYNMPILLSLSEFAKRRGGRQHSHTTQQ